MKPKEDNESNDLFKDINLDNNIPANGPELLRLFLRSLRKLAPFLQILLAVASLIVAVAYAIKLKNRLVNSQESTASALKLRLEPTSHQHQGVPTFVLSGIEVPPADNQDYTEELKSNLRQIDEKIKETIKDPKSLDAKKIFDSFDPEITGSGSAWYQVVMNTKNHDVFVMVPAISIRRNDLTSKLLDKQNLKSALIYNPEILSDLQVVANIAPLMKNLDGMSVQSLPITQQYLISESGVISLRESNVEDNISYYKGQFYPATLFMDRSYFRGAVKSSIKYGPFNYRTQPYIDAGGNGVVITYSKTVTLANQRMGILCVDVKLPGALDVIKKRLGDLGADVGEFHWITDKGLDGVLPEDFEWVEDQLSKQRHDNQSTVLGAIAVESDYPPQQKVQDSSGVIRFTIPIDSKPLGEGARKTKLLWARINPASNRGALIHDLIWFSTGMILLVVVLSNIIHEYTMLRREMSSVLKKMSEVMYEASTPFAWLNEKNEFLKVNESFVTLLDYVNEEELKSHSPTFRGLVTAESQPKYDEVLAQSAAGEETGKYEIDIVTKKGDILHVTVHGERIPYPTIWRRGLPHRFGVFLEWSKKIETKQPETNTLQHDDAIVFTKPARAQRRTEPKVTINKNGKN